MYELMAYIYTRYDKLYAESIEASSSFNKRLIKERKDRIPYIDAQTRVAQCANQNLWLMEYQRRTEAAKSGYLYSYPMRRWFRNRRSMVYEVSDPTAAAMTANANAGADCTAIFHTPNNVNHLNENSNSMDSLLSSLNANHSNHSQVLIKHMSGNLTLAATAAVNSADDLEAAYELSSHHNHNNSLHGGSYHSQTANHNTYYPIDDSFDTFDAFDNDNDSDHDNDYEDSTSKRRKKKVRTNIDLKFAE